MIQSHKPFKLPSTPCVLSRSSPKNCRWLSKIKAHHSKNSQICPSMKSSEAMTVPDHPEKAKELRERDRVRRAKARQNAMIKHLSRKAQQDLAHPQVTAQIAAVMTHQKLTAAISCCSEDLRTSRGDCPITAVIDSEELQKMRKWRAPPWEFSFWVGGIQTPKIRERQRAVEVMPFL